MELENFENLIDLAITTEERFLFSKLGKNASNSPDIHSQAVLLLSEQYLRSTIPKSFNLVSKCFDGKTEGSCESKVCDFEGSCPVNEEILWFEISVNDPASMAVVDAVAKLIEEEFNLIGSHGMFVLAQVFLHVVVHKFKDQVKFFFRWDVDHFF